MDTAPVTGNKTCYLLVNVYRYLYYLKLFPMFLLLRAIGIHSHKCGSRVKQEVWATEWAIDACGN